MRLPDLGSETRGDTSRLPGTGILAEAQRRDDRVPRLPSMPRRQAVAVVACLVLLGSAACGGHSDPSGQQASGQKSVDKLVRTGIEQLESGQTETARGTFQSVLTLDSSNAYAHYNLGLIAQQAGDFAGAMKQYDAALATRPDLSSALYNKGILTEADDLPAAVGLYRTAVASKPDFAPAHMRLGFALLHLGKETEGEKELAAGVKLDPSMASVEAPSYG